MYVCMYGYMCVCVYIYIYVYICCIAGIRNENLNSAAAILSVAGD